MDEPVVSRVHLPTAYGAPQDSPLLEWPGVAQRLAEALHYWVSTADASGAPISRPVDGNWVQDALILAAIPSPAGGATWPSIPRPR